MTNARPLEPPPWRQYAWVVIALLLSVPLQLAALMAASSVTNAIGIGYPEREHFAVVATLLGGFLTLAAVPASGRLIGLRVPLWAGWDPLAAILLAAVAAFALFEDVRSGLYFETDHALPEIFLPYAVILLASCAMGHRLAGGRPAATAWPWLARVTSVVTVGLIGLTAAKMVAFGGGDFALDSPLTVVVLAAIGVYVVFVVSRAR